MRELTYVPVAGAVRHGTRPPKLAKMARLAEPERKSQNPHPLKAEGAAPRSGGRVGSRETR